MKNNTAETVVDNQATMATLCNQTTLAENQTTLTTLGNQTTMATLGDLQMEQSELNCTLVSSGQKLWPIRANEPRSLKTFGSRAFNKIWMLSFNSIDLLFENGTFETLQGRKNQC